MRMHSGLITEILEVESEADRIVSEARSQARVILAEAHRTGDISVREASQQARDARYKKVQEAREASDLRIKHASEARIRAIGDPNIESAMVSSCIDAAVAVLCRTKVGKVLET